MLYFVFLYSQFQLSILCSCISIIRIHAKYQNRCQNWDFSSDRILVGIRDFQAKTGKSRRHRDGWTVCFTHTQKCPVQCRVKKRPDISSKYFKTNQNAKLYFCACLNFGQFLAGILHLTQKAAKCTTCKHLFGKSQLVKPDNNLKTAGLASRFSAKFLHHTCYEMRNCS